MDDLFEKLIKPIKSAKDGLVKGYSIKNQYRNIDVYYKEGRGFVESTGVQDKYGRKILEGDLIKAGHCRGHVMYKKGAYIVKWLEMPGDPANNWDFLFDLYDHCEVLRDEH